MPIIEPDTRSPERRALDERIAAEAESEAVASSARPSDDAPTYTIEDYLRCGAPPRAISGVVENGVVRPLDPAVTLPEQARVLFVTAGG